MVQHWLSSARAGDLGMVVLSWITGEPPAECIPGWALHEARNVFQKARTGTRLTCLSAATMSPLAVNSCCWLWMATVDRGQKKYKILPASKCWVQESGIKSVWGNYCWSLPNFIRSWQNEGEKMTEGVFCKLKYSHEYCLIWEINFPSCLPCQISFSLCNYNAL